MRLTDGNYLTSTVDVTTTQTAPHASTAEMEIEASKTPEWNTNSQTSKLPQALWSACKYLGYLLSFQDAVLISSRQLCRR